MLFGRSGDVPVQISKIGLDKWYSGLSDQDKVRLGRYLDGSDVSSGPAFFKSVMDHADEDHNYALSVSMGEYALGIRMEEIERFYILEDLIIAYFHIKDYDRCLECCDSGLGILPRVRSVILEENSGVLPERLNCRNYKINVIVGVRYQYDEGDRILEQYYTDGLISKEDLEYRKQSHKIFRLQKSFDGIYALKIKEG
jgi:hypothetical protein